MLRVVSSEPLPRTRRARGSLSANEILDAAAKIVEHESLDQLSMPQLARTMGCGVTSLYWYFRSKDELVVALVERVTRDAFTRLPPVGNGPWDEELVDYFANFRSLMHRTPLYREVFAHRSRLTFEANRLRRQVLRRTDAGLELLTRAGFTPQHAAVLHTIFSNYTMGFILREYGAADEDEEDVAAVNSSVARLGAGELPTLSQVDDYGYIRAFDDEQFLAGLRLLLQGVRRELEAPELTASRKATRRPRPAKAGNG
jgi:AcrR family transcriptional regulator